MTSRGDITRAVIAILAVCLFMAFTSGCIEEEQRPQPPIWGKGDLPSQWTEYFPGNDNLNRLNFKQSALIDELVRRVRTLEINQYIPDPNGVKR